MTSRNDSKSPTDPQLSFRDRELLDQLVEAGFDREAFESLSGEDQQRLDSLTNLFGLMNDYPVEDVDEALVHATLARVDREEQSRADRMSFENRQAELESSRGRRWLPVPDFITVAAIILIGVGIGWPLMNSVRERSIDAQCSNNMRVLASAFDLYANDNEHSLPVAMAGPIGGWDSVKNVLNLAPLVNGGYCDAGHLNCPGNHKEHGPSYSYRWFVPGSNVNWGVGHATVVIGDLNPVVEAARAGKFVPALSVSINHAGRGQNVLISDGSTAWLVEPVVERDDNIWLPNGSQTLLPGDTPTEATDVFLTH